MARHLNQLLLALALGTGLLSSARAQTPTAAAASLTGQVSSAQGEALPNASVTVISLATSLCTSALASAMGMFALPNLLPGGPYVVQVQQPGFQAQTLTNVFLKAGEPTVLTITLNPATVAVGTRRDDRNALESAVPVDVVEIGELVRTVPQTDLTQLL